MSYCSIYIYIYVCMYMYIYKYIRQALWPEAWVKEAPQATAPRHAAAGTEYEAGCSSSAQHARSLPGRKTTTAHPAAASCACRKPQSHQGWNTRPPPSSVSCTRRHLTTPHHRPPKNTVKDRTKERGMKRCPPGAVALRPHKAQSHQWVRNPTTWQPATRKEQHPRHDHDQPTLRNRKKKAAHLAALLCTRLVSWASCWEMASAWCPTPACCRPSSRSRTSRCTKSCSDQQRSTAQRSAAPGSAN
jgi:hypothetical protein